MRIRLASIPLNLPHSVSFGALGNELFVWSDDIRIVSVSPEVKIVKRNFDPVVMECEADFWGGDGICSQ